MLKIKTFKPHFVLSLIPVIAASLFLAPQTALADDNEPATAWTMSVRTEQLQGQFQYKGAAIAPVAKLTVQYYPTASESPKKAYENIWYHDGKPIGLQRFGDLGLDKGKNVSLLIVPKTQAGDEEEKGAADIILRLVLDCYRNSDGVLAVTVPANNFGGIERAMNARGCVELKPGSVDQAANAKLSFTLQSDSDDQAKHLFYQ